MSALNLLEAGESPPYSSDRVNGQSSFVITVDHASNRIPRRLGTLGLPPSELERHVAWDIGALAVAQMISEVLDAPLIAHNYSRLVIDCNRVPGVDSSIPTLAESTEIPGNAALTEAQKATRRSELFDPYHAHLQQLIDRRLATGLRTILLAQHTMTDIFSGLRREMHAAVLYWRDRRFADVVLQQLRQDRDLLIGDNDPYRVDESHFTIPHHAERRGLPYVEIEVRQDLVSDGPGQATWARRIASVLSAAERTYYQNYAH